MTTTTDKVYNYIEYIMDINEFFKKDNENYKVIIFGGFIRDYINNDNINDVDIYIKNCLASMNSWTKKMDNLLSFLYNEKNIKNLKYSIGYRYYKYEPKDEVDTFFGGKRLNVLKPNKFSMGCIDDYGLFKIKINDEYNFDFSASINESINNRFDFVIDFTVNNLCCEINEEGDLCNYSKKYNDCKFTIDEHFEHISKKKLVKVYSDEKYKEFSSHHGDNETHFIKTIEEREKKLLEKGYSY